MSNDNNAQRMDRATNDKSSLTQDVVTTVATVGVIAAGVALLEVALIPGMVLGGAAVLAPRLFPKSNLLPKNLSESLSLPGLRRRLKPLLDFSPPVASKAPLQSSPQNLPVVKSALPVQFTIKQAIAKTITYRIIVTTLDFTVNYVVIGEVATAAGLSAFALVVGPLFYLAHEAMWNRFGDADKRVDLTAYLPWRLNARTPSDEAGLSDEASSSERPGFTISRALAKTITFRTIATTMDFTTNFVVVGDLVTALTLSASGFILGPFVYFGHEMAWDYYGSPGARPEPEAPVILLPAPG
ncbi:MAG: DUF2061 domain-containing protein [Bradyrhizobium sp.]